MLVVQGNLRVTPLPPGNAITSLSLSPGVRIALRRLLERGAAMMSHPLRALARTILALVAPIPAALEGRMWMRIGPRAVTCLSDSGCLREREKRTEGHKDDCFEHLRLQHLG
jgi:hypothetical protein